jgi:predicted outer membrane repeat protein
MNTTSICLKYLAGCALMLAAIGGAQRALAATGPRCYVDASAVGSNSGNSWKNAYTDLQSALADANCTKIWVSEGLYKPTADADNRTASFNVPAGVEVYGGFDGTETELAQRDPGAHVTVLSGDVEGDDTTDEHGVVQSHTQLVDFNSYHVVTMDGTVTPVLADTVLDGFTVTAGQANGAYPANLGGGFYCGGAAAGQECSPTITDVLFSGNKAAFGGALGNHATGGGISSPALLNVTFRGNNAGTFGGAVYNAASGGTSSPGLTNVTFSGNSSGRGGAIYNDGHDGNSSPTLRNVTFQGNTANEGGAIYNNVGAAGTSSPALSNVILWGNSAWLGGSQMYNNSAAPSISHSVVQGGDAGSNAGTAFSDGIDNTLEDPGLLELDDYGGHTPTIALAWEGSAVDAGDDATCAAAPVNGQDQRGVERPKGAHCDIGAFELQYKTITSQGANDGWVLESSSTSEKGGSKDSAATTFRLGDSAAKKQYRSILSFDTSILPDKAQILRVVLRIKKSGLTGSDPFLSMGDIHVDAEKGYFGSEATLQNADFQAAAGAIDVMLIENSPVEDWYEAPMGIFGFTEIKKTGKTQFRLQFGTGNSDDEIADYLKFYSGNAVLANRPVLIVTYWVP